MNIVLAVSNSNHLGNLGLILYFSSKIHLNYNYSHTSLLDYIPKMKGLIGMV